MPFHVGGKFVCAGEFFVAYFAQSLLCHHFPTLLLLATGLAMSTCDLFTRELFPTDHTRVDEPPLNAGVCFLMESEAVSSICGKAAVGKTALQKFYFSVTSLVSFQVTRVPKPPLTLRTNIRLPQRTVAFHIHPSPRICSPQWAGVIYRSFSHLSYHHWLFYNQEGKCSPSTSLIRAWWRSSIGRLPKAGGPSGSSRGKSQSLFSYLAL